MGRGKNIVIGAIAFLMVIIFIIAGIFNGLFWLGIPKIVAIAGTVLICSQYSLIGVLSIAVFNRYENRKKIDRCPLKNSVDALYWFFNIANAIFFGLKMLIVIALILVFQIIAYLAPIFEPMVSEILLYAGYGLAFLAPIVSLLINLLINYFKEKDYTLIGESQDIERLVKLGTPQEKADEDEDE